MIVRSLLVAGSIAFAAQAIAADNAAKKADGQEGIVQQEQQGTQPQKKETKISLTAGTSTPAGEKNQEEGVIAKEDNKDGKEAAKISLIAGTPTPAGEKKQEEGVIAKEDNKDGKEAVKISLIAEQKTEEEKKKEGSVEGQAPAPVDGAKVAKISLVACDKDCEGQNDESAEEDETGKTEIRRLLNIAAKTAEKQAVPQQEEEVQTPAGQTEKNEKKTQIASI